MIRGERLYLRSIERDDLGRCHAWMNDEDLRATLAQRHPMSLAKEADWVRFWSEQPENEVEAVQRELSERTARTG